MGATYTKRGKKFLVAVHANGQRQYKMVRSEADAKALVQHIHKQELAGINVVEAIRKARTAVAPAPSYPKLRDALPEWLTSQERAGEIRFSTFRVYAGRLGSWVYPHKLPDGRLLGDLPVDQVSREMLGAVLRKAREAGRSLSLLMAIRNPLKTYYDNLIETKVWPGPNPAADLKFFVGKGAHRKAKARVLAFFAQEEGPPLIATAKALYPRWSAFILTGLLAGLRWGESAALYTTDIDWKKGRLHVQRTVSAGYRMEAPKDHEGRHVKMSPHLMTALRAHVEAMALDGQVQGWTPEQRRLVFPRTRGEVMSYGKFIRNVWVPLLKKSGLPYRRYHATRHTFATWLLSDGVDIRWVQQQLGHASITQTADTYGHVQPERHEAAVERLDAYLR